MKGRGKVIYPLLIALVFALVIDSNAQAPVTLLSMATDNSSEGTFYPIGCGLATYVSKVIKGLNVAVEGSTGSAENLRRVNAGESEMGIVNGADMFLAYTGQEGYAKEPCRNIRAVGFLYHTVGHLVALKGRGIGTVGEARGMRIALGPEGSDSALAAERYFKHLGLWDRIEKLYLLGSDSSATLKNGRIDLYNWYAGIPAPIIIDTASTHDIVIIDLATPAEERGFFRKYPFYSAGKIPEGTYRGLDKPLWTIRVGTYWIVQKDVPADLVYNMVKAAYSDDGYKFMVKTHGAAIEMRKENGLYEITIPLHPGAERYWRETGLAIPDTIKAID